MTDNLVGEDGKVHRDWRGASLTIKAMVGYPGSVVTDLIIGGHTLQINNRLLKGVVVTAKKRKASQ